MKNKRRDPRYQIGSLLLFFCPIWPLAGQLVPIADHHQHLFSPAAGALVSGDSTSQGISARDVIALLDSAGIRRALVLSVAYTWGSANRTAQNEYEKVKAENDWTAAQVALYPDRLRLFCSFNPLKPYAMDELSRCAKDKQLRRGLKLHFGNSDVDLDNPLDVKQVRKIFAARHDSRVKNLWFDVTSVVLPGISPEKAKLAAARIREIGVRRVVYGSDAHAGGNPAPRELWKAFLELPLTQEEFGIIAHNLAPYMRW